MSLIQRMPYCRSAWVWPMHVVTCQVAVVPGCVEGSSAHVGLENQQPLCTVLALHSVCKRYHPVAAQWFACI